MCRLLVVPRSLSVTFLLLPALFALGVQVLIVVLIVVLVVVLFVDVPPQKSQKAVVLFAQLAPLLTPFTRGIGRRRR